MTISDIIMIVGLCGYFSLRIDLINDKLNTIKEDLARILKEKNNDI